MHSVGIRTFGHSDEVQGQRRYECAVDKKDRKLADVSSSRRQPHQVHVRRARVKVVGRNVIGVLTFAVPDLQFADGGCDVTGE